MLEAYHTLGMTSEAVFSLYVRKLPPDRNFLVACGLDDLLDDVAALRFGKAEIEHLASLGLFRPAFLDWLRDFRFTGDIHAVKEGTPVFPNEPILEVVAPIGEAQLLETLVINQIGFQTLIASKAARVVRAARDRGVVDFGSRRAQGLDAAVKGARAAYIAGVSATSNVQAGRRYGIPVTGTVAHSFIQAFPNELEAFRAFSRVYPDTTLLVDTYDTPTGVENVIALAAESGPEFRVRAIRLDSGDLLELARDARRRLDAAGLQEIRIVASGGLDEWKIERLLALGAPIDAFGVGTDMLVSTDAPALDIAYKLASYDGEGRMKLSPGKRNLPGRKQVFRQFARNVPSGDVIARHDENLPGRPLLEPVMLGGRRTRSRASAASVRTRAMEAIAELPVQMRALTPAETRYPVAVSGELARFAARTAGRLTAAVAKNPPAPPETPRRGAAVAEGRNGQPEAQTEPDLCPICGGPVVEEHGVFKCTFCGQVVESCCEGVPPPP